MHRGQPNLHTFLVKKAYASVAYHQKKNLLFFTPYCVRKKQTIKPAYHNLVLTLSNASISLDKNLFYLDALT